ncbi:LOW QUALITY PROTEIN: uncharacterized protein B0I36DRAFT_322700 [Microdochium trichocladiopsis]|uniref:Nephrocystin 3-like N-terminal domain-containing protein n=1 Tax=Microdochium trichocladiopsis TaxID=1682393 RepID=A0A9P9BN45_9PEZI|nr:LOW QUALITY PROTEIN: uncharacterized protein B0I36DRAFT_322700 [Microdochium trichocladiopsis]KAH7030886.1 LOW QUALITY PROTEIN: hypothetical protein B0I36DRAFT_322700 [Microdochium trichocladiopsis]
MVSGAIFFGTPSTGMPRTSVEILFGKRPDRDLFMDLSDRSQFLGNLEIQFAGVSYLQRAKMFWAYEAQPSEVVLPNMTPNQAGTVSQVLVVDEASATSNRWRSEATSVFQINESHSGMIRFGLGDYRIQVLVDKIRDICWSDRAIAGLAKTLRDSDLGNLSDHALQTTGHDDVIEEGSLVTAQAPPPPVWQYELIVESLRPPQENKRLEQIEANFRHTFNWAYEDSSIGLSKWLRDGSGIFWVSGKPGSGKSTFMKFLLNERRTSELLHNWRSTTRQIVANFFFHHRGTLMQKSFEGLLRELLSQLLRAEQALYPILGSMLDARLQETILANRVGSLATDVRGFLYSFHARNLPGLASQLIALLALDPAAELDTALTEIMSELSSESRLAFKRILLVDFDSFSNPVGMKETIERETERVRRSLPDSDPMRVRNVISTWRDRVDLARKIREFLAQHKLDKVDPKSTPLQEAARDPATLLLSRTNVQDQLIRDLAVREKRRQKIRLDLQLNWSQTALEECLRRVFDQDIKDLRICLFFDALDEYDGRPEVIAGFLQDLVKSSPSSRTQARVLFSSRPWAAFQEEFGQCPGFRIHEHTKEDIREYCNGILRNDKLASSLLLPMAEEIATRAKGDLSSVAARTDPSNQNIGKLLYQCLEAVPDELDEYYTTIVQRLPKSSTKETYILLECLSKDSGDLKLDQVPLLIKIAQSPTFVGRGMIFPSSAKKVDVYLKSISGGLVNVVSGNGDASRHMSGSTQAVVEPQPTDLVQLMHQTCKEWTEEATFKHIVLGDRANTAWENGHSFMAKYLAYRMVERGALSLHADVTRHLVAAERTTGVSQYRFLSSAPKRFYTLLGRSGLDLAVSAGLRLYLTDLVHYRPEDIRNCTESLFTFLLGRLRWHKSGRSQHAALVAEIVDTGQFLLRNGYQLQGDYSGISELMMRLWDSPDQRTTLLFAELVMTAVQTSLSLDVFVEGIVGYFAPGIRWKLLHLSPPALAEWLIETQGAQVNILNSAGQTPLDYLFDPESVHSTHSYGTDWQYRLLSLFVQHGGRFARPPQASHILQFSQRLSGLGFDVHALIEAVAPGFFWNAWNQSPPPPPPPPPPSLPPPQALPSVWPAPAANYAWNIQFEPAAGPDNDSSGLGKQQVRKREKLKSFFRVKSDRRRSASPTYGQAQFSPYGGT